MSADAAGCGSGEVTYYRVTVYVKEFRSDSTIAAYYGPDREIALAYVRGYTGSGKYVHLTEQKVKIRPLNRTKGKNTST